MGELNWSELLHFGEYLKLLVGLLAITDPIGCIPIFLMLTAGMTVRQKSTVVWTASLTFLIAGLIFVAWGEGILALFSITIEAFQIAGGILLLLDGIAMMRSEPLDGEGESAQGKGAFAVGLAPLAIPLLAGPGAMSTLVIYSNFHPSLAHLVLLVVAVLTTTVAIFVAFRLAIIVGPLLGANGQLVMNRVMGLIVLAIGVEFIMEGSVAFIQGRL